MKIKEVKTSCCNSTWFDNEEGRYICNNCGKGVTTDILEIFQKHVDQEMKEEVVIVNKDQPNLEEIMKGNITPSSTRTIIGAPLMAIYIKTRVIRLNKICQEDLGQPKQIAFFITGKNAFFIADPEAEGLKTFNLKYTRKDCTIGNALMVDKLTECFDIDILKIKNIFKLEYKPLNTNKFGVIFQLHLAKIEENQKKR